MKQTAAGIGITGGADFSTAIFVTGRLDASFWLAAGLTVVLAVLAFCLIRRAWRRKCRKE